MKWGTEHLTPRLNILPTITNRPDFNLQFWENPACFAWINYWSKELAGKMGFIFEKDQALFYQCSLLADGGVLFQLTEQPLNISNDAHAAVLNNCYERFRRVGNQYLLDQ